jgi:hypothetical protein
MSRTGDFSHKKKAFAALFLFQNIAILIHFESDAPPARSVLSKKA